MNDSDNAQLLGLAIAFVVLLGGGFALRMWASNQAGEITGPNALHVLESGEVVAVGGGQIWVHDRLGALVNNVPVSAFGSDNYVGPLWAEDADTIIIRNDANMDDSTAAGIRSVLRKQASSLKGKQGLPVLQRCRLSTRSCTALDAAGAFHTRRVFGLARDPRQQRWIVSDTMAGELIELDESGAMLRHSERNFIFPNDLKWVADKLWVADTNHHRLAQVSVNDETLGTVTSEFAASGEPPFVWPTAFAAGSDDSWWVLNSNNAFTESRLFRFDDKGRIGEVTIPGDTDLLDIEFDGQSMLAADYRGFAIHSIDLDGKTMRPYGSTEFREAMASLKQRKKVYEVIKILGLIMMIGVLALLLIAQRKSAQDQSQG